MINDFPARLRQFRHEAGLTQLETAKRLYIAQNTYSKYELGKTSPNPDMLKRIAEIFGCSVADLVGEDPPADAAPADAPELTPQERELVEIYRRLDLKKQARLIDALLTLEAEP